MKNKQLFELRAALNDVDYIRGKIFAYAVLRNKEALDKEIERFNTLRKQPHPDYITYENERTLMCQEWAEKDENGKPVVKQNQDGTSSYDIRKMEEFNTEFIKLAEKYKEVLDDMNQSKIDFDQLMEQESDIVFKKVSINDLPDEVSAATLEKIIFMLD